MDMKIDKQMIEQSFSRVQDRKICDALEKIYMESMQERIDLFRDAMKVYRGLYESSKHAHEFEIKELKEKYEELMNKSKNEINKLNKENSKLKDVISNCEWKDED